MLPFPSTKFPQIKVFLSSYASNQIVKSLGTEELYKFQPYKITKDEIDKNCNNIVMIVRPSLNIHLKGSWIKLTIGLGKGRKLHDKRHAEKKKQSEREVKSALARYK